MRPHKRQHEAMIAKVTGFKAYEGPRGTVEEMTRIPEGLADPASPEPIRNTAGTCGRVACSELRFLRYGA